jgi:hypothetical protein
MNRSLIIALVFISSSCSNIESRIEPVKAQSLDKTNIFSSQDSIISLLYHELENENLYNNFSILTNEMISILEKSKLDSVFLFPYSKHDSIVLLKVENDCQKKIRALTLNERNKLIHLLNNPMYYQWCECGTPIPEYNFVIYLNGNIIANVYISCDREFVQCSPNNYLLRYGALKSTGELLLQSIMKFN